jgi:hypothetical protein
MGRKGKVRRHAGLGAPLGHRGLERYSAGVDAVLNERRAHRLRSLLRKRGWVSGVVLGQRISE